jgi:hypothetical protein
MDEITFIGQRTTKTVHETDRTSSALLAKAYQHLMAHQPQTIATRSSVHHGVTMNANANSTQEVQG